MLTKVSYEDNVKPYLGAIAAMSRAGLNAGQIATNLGIGRTAFFRWKKEHKELEELMKSSRATANFEVENALFKRAVGYDYTETKEEFEFGILQKKTKTLKHVSPDVGAIAWWQKNRDPENWKQNRVDGNEKDLEVLDALLSKIDAVMQEGKPDDNTE